MVAVVGVGLVLVGTGGGTVTLAYLLLDRERKRGDARQVIFPLTLLVIAGVACAGVGVATAIMAVLLGT